MSRFDVGDAVIVRSGNVQGVRGTVYARSMRTQGLTVDLVDGQRVHVMPYECTPADVLQTTPGLHDDRCAVRKGGACNCASAAFAPMPVYWLGGNPERCDTCRVLIGKEFVDAVHVSGRWAVMCMTCHSNPLIGRGKMGPGFGQRFQLQPNGRYLKVEG